MSKLKSLVVLTVLVLCSSCGNKVDEADIYTKYSGKDNGTTVSLILSEDGIYDLQIGDKRYMGPWEVDYESSLCDGFSSGVPVYYYNYLAIPYSIERRKVLSDELANKKIGPISGDCIRVGPFGRLFMTWDAGNNSYLTEVN